MVPNDGLPLADLTAYERDLLVIVNREGPANGIELKPALDAARGEAVSQAHFYTKLNDLVDRGLIEKRAVSGSENRYGLTKRGQEVLHRYANWIVGR